MANNVFVFCRSVIPLDFCYELVDLDILEFDMLSDQREQNTFQLRALLPCYEIWAVYHVGLT